SRALEHVSQHRIQPSSIHASDRARGRLGGDSPGSGFHVDSDRSSDGPGGLKPLMELNSKLPSGPIQKAWDQAKFDMKLVNPANKRKYDIIVVGSGLAGASASATPGEVGSPFRCFCLQ